MDLQWAGDIVEACQASGTAVFVKQLGSCWNKAHHKDIDEFPAALRVREYPQTKQRVPA